MPWGNGFFEDVIYLWDCIPDFVERLGTVSKTLLSWLSSEFEGWMARTEWREAVECCVEQGSAGRVARILKECEAFAFSNAKEH